MQIRKTMHLAGVSGLLAVLSITTLVPVAAKAQEGQQKKQSLVLEEVLVTARKREENIQDVPVAITALSSEDLRVKGVTKPDDLQFHTPGLEVRTSSIQRASISYFIRGQGQTFGSSPSVVTYFADAPLSNSSRVSIGNNSVLFDLSSVQVLKGPQGTLFGRSTTGGAVLFQPQRPTGEFGGFIQQSVGNYNFRETNAAINIPIIKDVLNARLAVNLVDRDGFTKSLTTGQDLDDRNRDSYRLGLEFQPNESINSYLMFARNEVAENNSGSVLTDFDDTNPIFDTTPFAGGGWFGLALPPGLSPAAPNGGLCYAINPGNAAGAASCISERLGVLDNLRNGLLAEEARFNNGGDDAKRYNTTGGELIFAGKTEQLLNITSVDIGKLGFLGDITLKNVFSTVRNLGVRTKYNAGSPIANGLVYNNFGMENFVPVGTSDADGHNDWLDDYSEEFQILGNVNDKHSWILGYYIEKQKYELNYPPLFGAYGNVFNPTPVLSPQVVSIFSANQEDKQTGVFAQTTIDLSDALLQGLKFTAGYRWTKSTGTRGGRAPDMAQLAMGNLVPSNVLVDRPAIESQAPSWTVGLDYQWNDDTLVYMAHRRGFKPGGSNVAPVVPVANYVASYDPETVDDFEIGIKSDWSLAGMPVRTNAAIYKMWYEDIQRNETFATASGIPFTQVNNIAKAEIQGLELSAMLIATERLQLGLNYSYIDAKYTEWPGFVANRFTGELLPYKDSPYVGTPEHQGSVSLIYSLPTPSEWGEMSFMADYYRQSSVWLNDTALEDGGYGKQGGYGNLNLRFDWANIGGESVDLALFVKNATDDVHAVAMSGFYIVGTAFAVYNEPRTWGAEIRYRFGDNK